MDEYLIPTASFMRLWNEYELHGSLVIAFDLDNTVYDFHKKGNTYNQVIELLRHCREHNCYLICFTANSDKDFVQKYLIENDIPFDAINENPPFFKSEERKIYFNALLDDRAGLLQVYTELNLLITLLNKKTYL
jgi:hydroxymethylpyrimidine pyrophosphatase-like HAD family hydrolase